MKLTKMIILAVCTVLCLTTAVHAKDKGDKGDKGRGEENLGS